MTDLVKDLFDLPERVAKSDFVLELTSGVAEPERTAQTYVVTAGLKDSFDRSLSLIGSSLKDGRSKASYLHGSFGSGKSHFMAILSLLIDGNEAVWKIPELHSLRDKHAFVGNRKLLQLRYHMIGAQSLEEKVLGEYVGFVRRQHPDAPLPGVFADDELFENARRLMSEVGEEKFLAKMGGQKAGWGTLASGWTRERFDACAASDDPAQRGELFSALVGAWFSSYVDGGRYVDIDTGLAAVARHAKELGYAGLVLYLDELILWLSHRASQQEWLHAEVQKMVKLVESQEASRAVPIVSFIARQRNLAEMVGKMHTGLEQQLLFDSLKHWEGRFDQITLEDRDLAPIVEKRVLKTKTGDRSEVDRAFEKLRATAGKSFETLQGSEDLAAFRRLYPFSPALVSALVALSNSLQRERTAIKLLMELLVEHIPDLQPGEVVRVGDLFDVLAGGDDPADGVMRARFNSAKELYKMQFLPVIQETNGTITPDRCQRLRDGHPIRLGCSGCPEKQCRIDNRIIKTLLIAALVPEVDELKNLTVGRLYRLNHGMLKAMIPGQEAGIVSGRIRKWAASIAQIQIGSEADPSVKVRLEGVDLKPILDRYDKEDSAGARQRVLREILFESLGVDEKHDSNKVLKLTWRGSPREGQLHFGNIRTMSAEMLRCRDDHDFRLIIDYPFDEVGRSPQEDVEALERFKETGGSWTLVWLPHFFSDSVKQLLRDLVVLEHIVGSRDVQRQAVQHLTVENQSRAINDMENLRAQKRSRLLEVITQAYGLSKSFSEADIDSAHTVESHLHVLKPGAAALYPELAANLAQAKEAYIEALLALRYPRHPDFTVALSPKRINAVVEKFAEIVAADEGRLPVDRELRRELAGTLGALDLVRFSETHVLKHEESRLQPLENKRLQKGAERPTVGELRAWIDEGHKMGLQSEPLDMVVRCYAIWARRTLELDGRPLDASVYKGELPERTVLEKPELPTQQDWSSALTKAGHCFGVTFAGKHLSPDNLGRFRGELDAKVELAAAPCAALTGLIEQRALELAVGTDIDRITTARSAEQAVLAVRGKTGVEQVRALAAFEPSTSGPAVGRHVGRAAELTTVLQDELVFGAFRQLAQRSAELVGAEELLDEARAAFRQDEVIVQLAPRLRELAKRAQSLLTRPAPVVAPESTLVTVKGNAVGKAAVRARLTAMVDELSAALERAEGDVELTGQLILKRR